MTSYRNITASGLEATGTAGFEQGQGQAFAAWKGKTLGFFGADLGSAAPSDGRVPAFLGLAERTGGVYVENPPSVADALKQTGLDFEVKHEPITAGRSEDVLADDASGLVSRPTGEQLPMTEWVATVAYPRDGGQPFAIAPTSKLYTIVQNEEALAVGDQISDGRLVALGAYGKPAGSKVYAAYELGEGINIGGGDPYRTFVTITTSHDRSGGLVALLAPIRLGCTNQTYATFHGRAVPRFTIRHTGLAKYKVSEARRVLGLAESYMEAFATEAETLLAEKQTKDQFIVYARHVFGVKDEDKMTERSKTIARLRDEQLLEILASQTNEFGRGTAYAGYQAVVEHMDHFGTVRGTDPVQARQERILSGQLDTLKERAWNLATV